MRCPKCGFISFDHLESCLKCGKDIQKTSSALTGTVYNVAAPSFLHFDSKPTVEEIDEIDAFEDEFEDMEIQDPDLDILLNEGEEETVELETPEEEEDREITMSFGDDEEPVDEMPDISMGAPEESEDLSHEIALDLGDFTEENFSSEMGDSFESDDEPKEPLLGLDLPDELSDMSDLEPPSLEPSLSEEKAPVQEPETDLDFNFDLDLDLDLAGTGGGEDKVAPAPPTAAREGTETPEKAAKKKREGSDIDMDEELNFDLDLHGLSFDDD